MAYPQVVVDPAYCPSEVTIQTFTPVSTFPAFQFQPGFISANYAALDVLTIPTDDEIDVFFTF